MRASGCLLVLGLLSGCAGTKAGSPAPARPSAASEPVLEVCQLQFASAETVAQELGKLQSEAESKVVVDPRTNSLILQGSPDWIAKIKQRIGELDKEKKSVELVPLKHANATEIASTLNELLEASWRAVRSRGCALPKPGKEDEMHREDWGPVAAEFQVAVDPCTKSLVVQYSDACDLPRLLELIDRLDSDADAAH